ncbi:family 20 glycosylhydrolase [Amycolatopsis sp.]|uniref:family 20 glycosylhydrolase n=1 Tax=Amycolatopsis sp. TaxID=37632 RepID=UPI002C8E128C|nr:family 20 glycosylhydrolase [Amycolatopsis sp.]HVV11184.1 family 20 glycosylhydrolase [Amycolatopsis sp.]
MDKNSLEYGVIPQPRILVRDGPDIAVRKLSIARLPVGLGRYRREIIRLASLMAGSAGGRMLPLTFVDSDVVAEGYHLSVGSGGIQVGASSSLGALQAMRTIVDLWDGAGGGALPALQIDDCPTLSTRGVFIESFGGTDLMGLDDWKALLDRVARFKFNTVGVSIYGCWDIHHGGDRSEYLFTPLTEFPEAVSPQHLLSWDPATGDEVEHNYVPRMFSEDFFGEVVNHARELGVEVIPHLGGPGHSSLIPRVVPDLSARDTAGKRTGYGYCVSQEAARNSLRCLVRGLTIRHLVPNGIRKLHVAGDEYYPVKNVDPLDRDRLVTPYCSCPGCSDLTAGEMLIEYFVQVGQVLAEFDVKMIHWQDSLVREGVLDKYLDRLEAERLPSPVIAWWKYNDPVPRPRTERAEGWCCPTTGLAPFLFHQDFLSNIDSMLRRGIAGGATGVLAYGSGDPADCENYAGLADLSWNFEGSRGMTGFRQRWAARICPGAVDEAESALSLAGTITACYPLMMYVIQQILPFFSSANSRDSSYPDDQFRAVALTALPLVEVVRQTADTLQEAVARMPTGRDDSLWGNPVDVWRQEMLRTAATLQLFLDVLAVVRQPTEPDESELTRLFESADSLLRSVASGKPAHLVPIVLRELWVFVREIKPAIRRLREQKDLLESAPWYPWLI